MAVAASDRGWIPYSAGTPDRNSAVEWITPSGDVVRGKFLGGLIWYPDGSDMYIYYTPTYWRYREAV